MEFYEEVKELVTVADTIPDLKNITRADLCCMAYNGRSVILIM